MLKRFLCFRCMITPIILQIGYWASTLACLFNGIKTIQLTGEWGQGLLIIFTGPIIVRVLFEIMMVFFRIYESLIAINQSLKQDRS